MKNFKAQNAYLVFALLLAVFMAGCSNGGDDVAVTPATPDTSAPTVTLTLPATAATDVPINRKVTATFSEEMTATTITGTTNFTVTNAGGTTVPGTVTYVAAIKAATFDPTDNLDPSTLYTATITTGVTDLAGNALAPAKVWTFTTGTASALDATPPTVSSTNPPDADTEVGTTQKVSAIFSEPLDPATIIAANFTVAAGVSSPMAGTLAYSGQTVTFTPTDGLEINTVYNATITTGVTDLAGIPLASAEVWSFTTSATVATGPAPVELGLAGNFVLLTKTGITNTGATHITGDIGVSPIDGTGMTGFSVTMDTSNVFSTSDAVTGRLYAADYAAPTPTNMTTSISNMETAYTDAAGRSLPDFTELGAGNISSMDLAPGLYKWSTGVLIDLNGVTLTGGANDVWIFQVADNLIVNNGAIITLAGGAQAKNVFWQVGGGTGVSLGTTVQMQGIILATKAITFGTGATLTGRALAQTNVTLDANTITAP